ncbi:MAG TPA: SWIM zinc finger family protein [Streptosporangiaceae bacterium]|nr:SWIM zinc finger family protein [Streptosporangiaceae bacterium]
MTGQAGAGRPETAEHTWWGQAWVDALEERARLDPNRLPRGRDYVISGAVGELALAPGEARAQVRGRRTQPYDVRIRVRRFTDDEWDQVLAAISAQLGHAAAMLEGDLPREIADDAAAAGITLLPGASEVGPRCTCPDDADPCKHAAAVWFGVADHLDADPFAVLLLRGRTRGEVLAGLRARRRDPAASPVSAPGEGMPDQPIATAAPAETDADAGVDARAVLAAPPSRRPVPVPSPPPGRPGHPAALPVDPPSQRAGLRADLLELAADAARRAWEMAVGLDADAGLSLSADADLARRAERVIGTPAFTAIASKSGVGGRELMRQALAWRYGRQAGLELLSTQWDPADAADETADLFKAAREALRTVSGLPAEVTGNRVTAGRAQLRLGRDLLWYPYGRSDGEWEPSGEPQPDPSKAAANL